MRSNGFHPEIYEDLVELSEAHERSGYILAADDPDTYEDGTTVSRIRAVEPVLPLVLYAEQPRLERVVDSVRSGAADYLAWPLNARLLDVAFARLGNEGAPEQVEQRRNAHRRMGRLTQREKQVLLEVINGRKNREIAEALGISTRTVEIHRGNLMRKMGANSPADLVRLGLEAGVEVNEGS
jgi:two-component system response regulator FixJ